MHTYFYSFLLSLFVIFNVCSQDIETTVDSIANPFLEINDGPYVFIENAELIEKTIVKGEILTRHLAANTYDTLFKPEETVFTDVKHIVALSDIHGQYDLAIELLQKNQIIDENLAWNFGQNHLVIVGDVFDRGEKVNELLWFIYKLEQQAKTQGGRVHFLLGNHEYMVLHNDLRYIHKKYRMTSALLEMGYVSFYDNNTVIGRWLRSKPTLVKINNTVFVHGGISEAFLSHNEFEIEKINEIMRASIDVSKAGLKSTDFYSIYYGSDSLIWYRGYFDDNLSNAAISDILKQINSEHIVVGHCSNEEVVQLYDEKIYGVDSSIKYGKYGELLFIKKNKAFRLTLEGKKKRFRKATTSK
ncbi:MAG: metallophosphoesterase [Altibacter sp.]|uniref:metallophosphoesterase n=1 Tax=Altibacter sp. TaxID=2024823 RepID=UPI001D1BFE64|nr:metallophosphoesterase [Altibacter sp.]MBZ0326117.1 metallophosphoesterase [Altibacter sp.]